MKLISPILILSLLDGVYRIKFGLTNGKSNAHRHVMCPLTYHPSLLIEIFLLEFNQSVSSKFLIVGLDFGAEILTGCSLSCKLFRKLLFTSKEINMSKQCLVEHKKVYCFMFP